MILSRSIKHNKYNGIDLEKNYTSILSYLQKYADIGLRTLVMAIKETEVNEYEQWIANVNKAETVIENRELVKAEWYEWRNDYNNVVMKLSKRISFLLVSRALKIYFKMTFMRLLVYFVFEIS